MIICEGDWILVRATDTWEQVWCTLVGDRVELRDGRKMDISTNAIKEALSNTEFFEHKSMGILT